MAVKALALLTCVILSLAFSEEKPVSLTYRCPCRFVENSVSKASVRHLRIHSTLSCSLQVIARLKHNNKQVCLDPKTKWVQEYLEKAFNKRARM